MKPSIKRLYHSLHYCACVSINGLYTDHIETTTQEADKMIIKQITKRTEKEVFNSAKMGHLFSHGVIYKDGIDRGTVLRFTHLNRVDPGFEIELTMLDTRRLFELLKNRVNDHETRIADSLAKAGLPNINFED